MNGEDEAPEKGYSKVSTWVLRIIIPVILGLVCYIFLESVGNPYWEQIDSFEVGTNWCRTVQVMNPGPWTKRKPYLEFPISANIKFLSQSPGILITSNATNWKITPEDDMPPGIDYVVTYQFFAREVEPSLMCDGKSCRNMRSSFDLDLVLKILGLGLGTLTFGITVFIIFYFDERKAHKKTVQNGINKAILTLLMRAQKEEGEEDVEKAVETIDEMPKEVTRVVSKPLARKRPNNP